MQLSGGPAIDHSPFDADPAPHADALPPEPPRWPTVVGTISIVWASLSILCGACGVLSPVLMQIALAGAEQQLGPMPAAMKPSPLQIGLAGVTLAWSFILLAAGIMLTLRKPVTRPLHLVYAAGALLLTIAGTAFGLMAQMALNEWVANNPDNKWAQQHNPIGGYVGLALSVVLGLAWPVFCLFWFGAVKRSPHQITGEPA